MTAIEAVSTAATEPHPYVRQPAARSGSSFGLAMLLLPRERRQALLSVYAFCRVVDDIADGPGPATSKSAALQLWRREIDAVYGGSPDDPAARALVPVVERFDLPKAEFLAMIEGMAWDVESAPIAPSFESLARYCRLVAGAAGLLSLPIFGANGREERAFAIRLGEALQLTNILRDLAEDAAIGRLYMPAELLARHGVPQEPTEALVHPALPLACADLAKMAQERFDEARKDAASCDRARLRPALAMMAVYSRLLTRLCQSQWRQLQSPTGLSRTEKLVAASRAATIGVLWPRFI